jgi:predicted transposase YbfD/YdcC
MLKHLHCITDCRSHINQDHDLVDICFLVLCAVISGAQTWADCHQFGTLKLDWLRLYRPYANGIPSQQSIGRIFRGISQLSLLEALMSWVNEHRIHTGNPTIAIDGKVLKGAKAPGASAALHLVTAYDTGSGLVFSAKSGTGKKSELKLVQELLSCLELKGELLTFDALHCQTQTLDYIVKEGGDCILQVKGNQPQLFAAVQAQFADYIDKNADAEGYIEEDKGHGRREKRITFQIPLCLPIELTKKWPQLRTLVAVERHRTMGKKTSIDTHFYVSSATRTAEEFGHAIRAHWQTENNQHWLLDTIFQEDKQKMYDEDGASLLAILRRWALNLVKLHPAKTSQNQKFNRACWSDDFREEIMFGVG